VRLLRLLILGATLAAPSEAQVDRPPDLAEVYRTALGAMEFEPLGSARKKHALIASTFDPGGMWRELDQPTLESAPYLDPRRRLTYARTETIESFLSAIETQKPLPAALGRLPEFLLVQPHDAPKADGWRAFERRHTLAPGVISVSRIGFDRSASQALLYVSFICGSLCGSDSFVLLERDGATWRVVKIDRYSES